MVDPQPLPPPAANGAAPDNLIPFPGSKRQRRPSVRLGDIGEQPASITYEPYVRRSKQWKLHPSSAASSDDPKPRHHPPPSKTRPLTNLAPPPDDPRDAEDRALIPVDGNLEPIAIRRGVRDGKARRGGGGSKRIRSRWASKVDDVMETADLKLSAASDAGDEGYREDSESLSYRNDTRGTGAAAAAARVRVSCSRDGGPAADAAERDAPSETNGDDRNNLNGRCRSLEDGGVRSWLNRLGLGRYAPVFEIHEVDEEVLPLLTLEDLKDMGVNAVGSRRKMYCAIQKLKKAFS